MDLHMIIMGVLWDLILITCSP